MCNKTSIGSPSSIFVRIVKHLNLKMADSVFINLYKVGDKSFTRNRFFTFKVLLGFLMTNLQKSIQREIALFVDAVGQDGGRIPEVGKSAFCKARRKLQPTVFKALSNEIVNEFYKYGEAELWHGYRIIGVDGSRIVMPNTKAMCTRFGVVVSSEGNKDNNATCMGQALTMYDTLNNITLYGSLDNIAESETSLLYKALADITLNKNDILVFDRYFASHLIFFYLQKLGVQFCFRMKSSWNIVKAFKASGKESQVLVLEMQSKDRKEAIALGITETSVTVRLTRVELDGGEIEILLTSLTDEQKISVADTKYLYGKRWPIEDSYKTFKNKVCIENFSGKTENAVMQDFYVKIFIMNLTAVAIRPINAALRKESVKIKYPHQVNLIEAVATMKRAVVSFFVTGKILKGIKRLFGRVSNITEPIRKDRKFKRKHKARKKYYMTQKPV
jgi:hypothetical protein